MAEARSFVVDIPDERLQAMRRRIRETEWPGDSDNANWRYGVEQDWLRDMARYWAEQYDWRRTEAAINALPNFKAEVHGVDIHFIHLRSPRKDAIPLVLTHGWPWTFWDWRHMIEPLAHGDGDGPAFDVVVPSIPGYGFSSPLRKSGIDAREVAAMWVTLMREVLGYPRFAAAGGDFGAIITSELGHAHADHLIGINVTTLALPGIDWYSFTPEIYADDEKWMIARTEEIRTSIASHMAVQTYDPQTLAYALADSPVGTAAWLWERRRRWSDCNGDIIAYQGRDFLCDLASIYWLTDTSGSAMRIYAEQFSKPLLPLHQRVPRAPTPTGCTIAPRDLIFLPRAMAAELSDLRRWTVLPRGGHFSPSEVPELLVEEYRTFFGELSAGTEPA